MGDTKPFLLTTMRNNMGAATVITYACSTKFYLQDRRDGRPWISKMPFPVQLQNMFERMTISGSVSSALDMPTTMAASILKSVNFEDSAWSSNRTLKL